MSRVVKSIQKYYSNRLDSLLSRVFSAIFMLFSRQLKLTEEANQWQIQALKNCRFVEFQLQRFAAEDEGRTEPPSDRIRREERQKGNIAKSSEIVSSSVLLGNITVIFFAGAYIIYELINLFQKTFSANFSLIESKIDEEVLYTTFISTTFSVLKIIGPIFLASITFAIIANIAQVGFLFTAHPLIMNLRRLIPKFDRITPNRKTAFALFRTIFQIICISIAAYVVLSYQFVSVMHTADMELRQVLSVYSLVVIEILFVVALLLMALAIPDFFFQKHVHEESLKVTIPDSKRETKEQETHPQIRQRQREKSYSLLKEYQQAITEVPNADVVVTNPTHYAVALRFRQDLDNAPVVIAKGSDNLAWVIRNLAKQNGVVVEENRELARTLYNDVEVGQEIPETLYRVVSVIFRRLYQMRGQSTAETI